MSLTETQTAFLNRKWKTYFVKQDVTGNGYLSFEDFEEIGKRFVKYGKLDDKKGKEIAKRLTDVLINFGLKGRGDQMSLEQFLAKQMELRADPRVEELIKSTLDVMFNVVDTNGGGTISLKEYQVFFKCLGIDESNAKSSFDGIDTSRNGVISKAEYLAAAVEFLHGLDRKSGATSFMGPLVD